ncbi:hypothetical protein OGATHE_000220 [Ogataea polymorpha]|uniref:Uncharacterized protein n=1 Tax=Ogataea polymorpha TaxID=460523 RepID=A0A9P8PW24_9ASCO|nr:hypothetical protein OGATHE_000220 [Ogataea polymorpha]
MEAIAVYAVVIVSFKVELRYAASAVRSQATTVFKSSRNTDWTLWESVLEAIERDVFSDELDDLELDDAEQQSSSTMATTSPPKSVHSFQTASTQRDLRHMYGVGRMDLF